MACNGTGWRCRTAIDASADGGVDRRGVDADHGRGRDDGLDGLGRDRPGRGAGRHDRDDAVGNEALQDKAPDDEKEERPHERGLHPADDGADTPDGQREHKVHQVDDEEDRPADRPGCEQPEAVKGQPQAPEERVQGDPHSAHHEQRADQRQRRCGPAPKTMEPILATQGLRRRGRGGGGGEGWAEGCAEGWGRGQGRGLGRGLGKPAFIKPAFFSLPLPRHPPRALSYATHPQRPLSPRPTDRSR